MHIRVRLYIENFFCKKSCTRRQNKVPTPLVNINDPVNKDALNILKFSRVRPYTLNDLWLRQSFFDNCKLAYIKKKEKKTGWWNRLDKVKIHDHDSNGIYDSSLILNTCYFDPRIFFLKLNIHVECKPVRWSIKQSIMILIDIIKDKVPIKNILLFINLKLAFEDKLLMFVQ